MKKLILQEWITIDGFAAGENGELDFFTSSAFKNDADEYLLDFIDSIDTILLGANTYKLFADYWPAATTDKEIVADKLNSTPKIVFSNSLTEAPWGKWGNAAVVNGNAGAGITKLLNRQGKHIVLWGSLSLAQSLIAENLISEYHLFICPVALGKGKPLFPPVKDSVKLNLLETKKYNSGLVLLQYNPVPAKEEDT